MSILQKMKKMFSGGDEDKQEFNWNKISANNELENILSASKQKTQVIFKHSNRCATSFFARNSVETFSNEDEKAVFYLVDVIKDRPISLYIADKLGIRHESPQLFIIRNEEVVWHGSHQQVHADVLVNKLN